MSCISSVIFQIELRLLEEKCDSDNDGRRADDDGRRAEDDGRRAWNDGRRARYTRHRDLRLE